MLFYLNNTVLCIIQVCLRRDAIDLNNTILCDIQVCLRRDAILFK